MTDQAIKQDAYDRLTFGSACQELPELRALNKRSAQAQAVLRDVHASLYKLRPQIDEESSAIHKGVIEQMMGTDEYGMLRASTRMDELGAAIGTLSLGQTLMQHLPEEEQQDREGEEQQDDGQGGWGCLLRGCADADDQRRKLRQLVKKAQEETEESVEAVQGLVGAGWGSGAGSGNAMSMDGAVQLAKRLRNDAKLARIAKLAGRMRRLASGKRETKLRHGPDDIVGVELGNDLASLLPSELQALCTPELETLAMLRYTQRRMLQLKREGKEKSKQGPIVVLVDESGSMEGEADEWAKAMALGVMSIAQRERREFACGTFNDYCRLSSWGKDPSMDAVLSFLGREPSGGTSFATALGAGMKLIEEARAADTSWSKADIVFITDGDCMLDGGFCDTFKHRLQATGAHLYTIGIGCRAFALDAISDGAAVIHNLNDDDAAIELAFGI